METEIPNIPDTEMILDGAAKSVIKTKNFIFENVIIIFSISLFLMAAVILLTVADISFKENETITSDVYVLEGYSNTDKIMKEQRKEDCSQGLNEVQKLCKKKGSGELGKKKCMKYDCCIWPEYKDKKNKVNCIPGDKAGPSISHANLGYDEYYYKNKKYKV